ncbi:unnamed protein product [Caenorhabditis brenneri]
MQTSRHEDRTSVDADVLHITRALPRAMTEVFNCPRQDKIVVIQRKISLEFQQLFITEQQNFEKKVTDESVVLGNSYGITVVHNELRIRLQSADSAPYS